MFEVCFTDCIMCLCSDENNSQFMETKNIAFSYTKVPKTILDTAMTFFCLFFKYKATQLSIEFPI